MEVSQLEKCIQEVLEEKFGCSFELVVGRELSHYHLSFRNTEFVLAFPIALTNKTSSSALKNTVVSWLERDFELIKTSRYVEYDEEGGKNSWEPFSYTAW